MSPSELYPLDTWDETNCFYRSVCSELQTLLHAMRHRANNLVPQKPSKVGKRKQVKRVPVSPRQFMNAVTTVLPFEKDEQEDSQALWMALMNHLDLEISNDTGMAVSAGQTVANSLFQAVVRQTVCYLIHAWLLGMRANMATEKM